MKGQKNPGKRKMQKTSSQGRYHQNAEYRARGEKWTFDKFSCSLQRCSVWEQAQGDLPAVTNHQVLLIVTRIYLFIYLIFYHVYFTLLYFFSGCRLLKTYWVISQPSNYSPLSSKIQMHIWSEPSPLRTPTTFQTPKTVQDEFSSCLSQYVLVRKCC